MRTETCIVTVYADPDTCQNVRVEYDIERGDEANWIIHRLRVLDDLTIEPDDLKEDLTGAIAFEEGINPWLIEFDCEINVNITAEQYVFH